MKIRRRTFVTINTILFSLSSVLYLIVVEALRFGTSAFDLKGLSSILAGYFNHFVIYTIFVILFLYLLKKSSQIFFLVQCQLVSLYSLFIFYETLNKVVLFLSFIYIVTSYYLYLLMKIELIEPYYNANFSDRFLSSYHHEELKIELLSKGEKQVYFITNWGENGFFCRGDNSSLRGKVDLFTTLDGVDFKDHGVIVARNKLGVGVRIVSGPSESPRWKDFCDIINELGLKPLS